jgi:flagellin-specific chaperone FliS
MESNGAYREEDYPDAGTIRGKFGIDVQTFPVPHNFRLPLNQDEISRMEEQITDFHKRTFNRSIKHLLGELFEPIKHASEMLLNENSKLHASVQTNLQKAIEIIPRLNLYGDETVNEMLEKAKKLFESSPIEFCRNSSIIRNHVGNEAEKLSEEIASKMANFDF